MTFPWRLYLAATLVGAFAGLIGGAFHAILDQGARCNDKRLLKAPAGMPCCWVPMQTALAELPERLQRLKPIIRPLAAGERLVVIEAP